MRFPFFRNRDSVKNGILISIRRTGDGFHPGLFRLEAIVVISSAKLAIEDSNLTFAFFLISLIFFNIFYNLPFYF